MMDQTNEIKKTEREKYEEECDKIRRTNAELLEIYRKELMEAGVGQRTVNRHLRRVDLYINHYLLREEPLTMEHGLNMIDDFMGNFLPNRYEWATPLTIKNTAGGIKKFYKYMVKHGKIEVSDYNFFCVKVKSGAPIWKKKCAQIRGIEWKG